jgi:hypothetical protein
MHHTGREAEDRPAGTPLCPGRMEQAAVGIAVGEAAGVLAARLGIGRRTLVRWQGRNDFRRRVNELRAAMTRAACGRLAESMSAAADTLSSLLMVDKDSVKIQAARQLLGMGTKLREVVEFEERLQAVEAKLAKDP